MNAIKERVSLAPMTTLRIGGPARFFLEAETEQDVIRGLRFAKEHDHELFVLGGGSNLLVSDEGIDGLVIKIAIRGIGIDRRPDRHLVSAAAGEDWDSLVQKCVDGGLAGIECMSGIPGSVGGTPVQNVGAYGQEVSESIVSVRCIDRRSGEVVELDNDECGFSYRSSTFNSIHKDRYIVLLVNYGLTPGGPPKIEYRDLIEYFAGRQPTLAEVREAVLNIRRSKSMVIESADPNSMSAGSFFKNPLLEDAAFEELHRKYSNVPSFPIGGQRKVPAAWLIENAGFYKGYKEGSVGLSTKHSLAVINLGGAKAMHVIDLKEKIQKAVFEKFGVKLVPEPVFVGFGPAKYVIGANPVDV
jgi:UDP-N-acetylmuramate dehydrogenase